MTSVPIFLWGKLTQKHIFDNLMLSERFELEGITVMLYFVDDNENNLKRIQSKVKESVNVYKGNVPRPYFRSSNETIYGIIEKERYASFISKYDLGKFVQHGMNIYRTWTVVLFSILIISALFGVFITTDILLADGMPSTPLPLFTILAVSTIVGGLFTNFMMLNRLRALLKRVKL